MKYNSEFFYVIILKNDGFIASWKKTIFFLMEKTDFFIFIMKISKKLRNFENKMFLGPFVLHL